MNGRPMTAPDLVTDKMLEAARRAAHQSINARSGPLNAGPDPALGGI